MPTTRTVPQAKAFDRAVAQGWMGSMLNEAESAMAEKGATMWFQREDNLSPSLLSHFLLAMGHRTRMETYPEWWRLVRDDR